MGRFTHLCVAALFAGCAPHYQLHPNLDGGRAVQLSLQGDDGRRTFGSWAIAGVRRGTTRTISMSAVGRDDASGAAGVRSSSNVETQSLSFVLRREARSAWRVRCTRYSARSDESGGSPRIALDCEIEQQGPSLALRYDDDRGSIVAAEPLLIVQQRSMGRVTGYEIAGSDGPLAAVDLSRDPPQIHALADPALPVAFALACLVVADPDR